VLVTEVSRGRLAELIEMSFGGDRLIWAQRTIHYMGVNMGTTPVAMQSGITNTIASFVVVVVVVCFTVMDVKLS